MQKLEWNHIAPLNIGLNLSASGVIACIVSGFECQGWQSPRSPTQHVLATFDMAGRYSFTVFVSFLWDYFSANACRKGFVSLSTTLEVVPNALLFLSLSIIFIVTQVEHCENVNKICPCARVV